MRKPTNKLLKFLIKNHSDNMTYSFKYKEYVQLGFSEQDYIYALNELQKRGYINYKTKSVHKNDFSYGVDVEVLLPAITYTEDKIHKWFSDRYDFIKFLIPTLIALTALIISLSD